MFEANTVCKAFNNYVPTASSGIECSKWAQLGTTILSHFVMFSNITELLGHVHTSFGMSTRFNSESFSKEG